MSKTLASQERKNINISPEDLVNNPTKAAGEWKHMSMAERSVRRGAPAMLLLGGAVFVSLLLQSTEPHAYAGILLIAVGGCGWIGRRAIGIVAGVLATAVVEYVFL